VRERYGTLTGRAAEEDIRAVFRALAELPDELRGCGVIFTEVKDVNELPEGDYSPDPAFRYDEERDAFVRLEGSGGF
jgi:hypothetical protein